jgi:hypothetical protein
LTILAPVPDSVKAPDAEATVSAISDVVVNAATPVILFESSITTLESSIVSAPVPPHRATAFDVILPGRVMAAPLVEILTAAPPSALHIISVLDLYNTPYPEADVAVSPPTLILLASISATIILDIVSVYYI